jgi:AraC-like DNA-binding protein
MEFSSGKGAEQRIYDRHLLQTEYGSYLVSGSRAVLVLFAEGRLLSQALEGAGFQIWFHDFFVEAQVALAVNSKIRLRTLIFVLQQNVLWTVARNEPIHLNEGRYYLLDIPATTVHSFLLSPGRSRIFQIDFSDSFADAYLSNGGAENLFPHVLNPESSAAIHSGLNDYKVRAIIHILQTCSIGDRRARTFFLLEQVMKLFVGHREQMVVRKDRPPRGDLVDEKMEVLQEYIQTHLDADLTHSRLSLWLHVSESVLRRLFKRYMKTTLHEYILQLRLSYAVYLLNEDKKQVTEIALLAGFKDVSGFRRAFKKRFGISPSQWERREN